MKPCNYRIGLIGYFAVGKSKSGGQEAKTCAVARALLSKYSRRDMLKIDTGNWKQTPFKFFCKVIRLIYKCHTIIIFPAQKSVRIFAPLLVLLGKPFGRKLHYVVIGGWLPEMTKNKKWLAYFLKKFNGIYVETSSMKSTLEEQGFKNIFIMPNFKDLPILTDKELVYTTKKPFAFCTFSRVMKEKGIEDAIDVINKLNEQAKHTIATLDIYGKIDDNYKGRFNKLKDSFPPYIKYKGIIPPNKSVEILKNYFALLFPTYYPTEGIPGTLIDAYCAGVPVITALWKNYKDVFTENKTGWSFELGNKNALLKCVEKAVMQYEAFNEIKPLCLQEAKKYMPKQAIQILMQKLEGCKA